MKTSSHDHPSAISLVILILFYVILIILILIFSRQIITGISSTNTFANTLALVISLALPVLLLGAIVFNLVRLIRERTGKRAGARLKTKLILFSTLIAVLSLTPQAILSVSFINSAINFWFSTEIGDALEGGLEISLEYYIGKVENLKTFSRSPFLSQLLRTLPDNPGITWANVRSANPEINLFQIFNQDEEEIFSSGEPGLRRFSEVRSLLSQPPVKKTQEDLTTLRTAVTSEIQGETYFIVLGITFPRKFDEFASKITTTRRDFKQLFQYRQLFRFVVVLFFILFSFPILLIAILISFLLADEIIRPIVNLEEATRRITEGDFSFRLLTRTRDELSELVGSFNTMIAELDSSRNKLVQAEKISAWREIAQRLAHEIKNPLTPIKLSAQRLLKYSRSGQENLQGVLESAVNAITAEVENLNKLLDEFREFSRLPEPEMQEVDLESLLKEVISMYRNLSRKVDIEQKFFLEKINVRADPNQMKQVFANLLKNAVQAMPEGGRIDILTDLVQKGNNRYVRMQFRDSGSGIPEEVRGEVFEPYFTTKKDGSGLGLAIAQRIVFDHNGSMWFESKEGSGTTFIVELPLENQ